MIKAVCFDLFSTLISATYPKDHSELDIVKMPWQEYESYSEGPEIYRERATGRVKTEEEMMQKIAEALPITLTSDEIKQLQELRDRRMRIAFDHIRDDVVEMLKSLKQMGLKVVLISNADLMDKKYWGSSRLAPYFDDVIFSCDVGVMKPDRRIYEMAAARLGVKPEECLFVGDGGSNELWGAKQVGMTTVMAEAFHIKPEETRKKIMESADHRIDRFEQIEKFIQNDK